MEKGCNESNGVESITTEKNRDNRECKSIEEKETQIGTS